MSTTPVRPSRYPSNARIAELTYAMRTLSHHLPERLLSVGLCAAMVGCGGSGGDDATPSAPSAPTATAAFAVTRATCGATDNAETALQGQVPASMRAAGFAGFSCNLQLIGQSEGEGASWQHASFTDQQGHRCDYYDTASPVDGTAGRAHLGTVVLDTTDQTRPTPTAYLTTTAMLDPWESLRVQPERQMLIAENGTNAAGGSELDVYDLSGDCRHPQLLSSLATGTTANGDAAALPAGQILAGHEGNASPDGRTWYSGDRGTPKKYTATDISDSTHTKLLTTWTLPQPYTTVMTTHGLSVSADGTRAYVSQAGQSPNNGILILDVSEVQSRKANPQIKQVSVLTWPEGVQMQHTIPITIKGAKYLVASDEGSASDMKTACTNGTPVFPMARLIDISDEKNPKVVSRLALETHDPTNCDKVLPDIAGLSTFTYGSHYCSVDNKQNATTLACSYFNSGIRVFDIRDAVHPKEIAYYNPAGQTRTMLGSQHLNPNALIKSGTKAGGPDWCSAAIRLDAPTGTLTTTCQDHGLLVLKFTPGVWPFAETSTPPNNEQN
jgi:hypothetical protein